MSKELIRLRDLCMAFDDELVLDNINLYINDSEFLTLLGPSGCGKTTTLRIIAGLELPDVGQVILEGQDITNREPNKRDVNTVFQNYALFPHMNVSDNVGYGLKIRKVPKAEIAERVEQALRLVQLEGYGKRMPDQLSGGQKQRIAIARAVINEPKVLLLDEPLGALDLKLRRQMQLELKRLQKQLGITFIYITHDQEEAINMSDTIAVMNHGRFEQIGTPDEIYNHPKTSYVATFVGNANILKGVVKEPADNNNHQITITTGSGEVQVFVASEEKMPQPGETVMIAVRSENIRFEENVKNIQGNLQKKECAEKIAHEGTQNHMDNTNSTDKIHGLTAKVTEKTFAGGQLRVVLKTTEGQEIIASRYGIDTNVNVGETVRCCFNPSDAVLVDRPEANAETNTQESNKQKAQRDNQSTTGGTHA